jgi:uncharacterized membrane protein SpoIIM required for sporulation
MRQDQFTAQQQPIWDEFRRMVEELERPRAKRGEVDTAGLPRLYRRLCADYALARSRHYGSALADELHDLVQRGHRQLYRGKSAWLWRGLGFLWSGFPNALRRHAKAFWLAVVLLFGSGLAMGLACYFNQDFIYTVLDPAQVAEMEFMYAPSNPLVGRTEDRASDTDFAMFGYYIWNNIGIGFRTFAGGMAIGIGSVLALLFNGIVIGAVAGHLTEVGYTGTFWPFVAGHSALELTAICISGAAGLVLGHALLAPGRRTRAEALKLAALEAVTLVMGAALMLLGAALVEAFWSSNGAVGAPVKYAVSAVLWLAVILYLTLAGRGHDAA